VDDLEYLRTGDIGLINDGYLYITSRLKDLVTTLIKSSQTIGFRVQTTPYTLSHGKDRDLL
jgi:hypothetical protein